MSRRLALCFALLIAAGLAARLSLVAGRTTWEHDDAISFLAATGHQGAYARLAAGGAPPYGVWAAAREWQRFVAPGDALIFGRIRADLARYDVHPPLYFWLLHLWTRAVGTGIRAGAWLNLGIDGLTALALYRLARDSFRDRARALAAVALWGLSSVALKTMLPARPYALLTLWAVVYAGAVLRTGSTHHVERERGGADDWRTAFFLMLTGAAGLLTHYMFGLALLAGGLAAAGRRDRAGLARVGIGAAGAVLAAVALHPHYFDPLRRGAGAALPADRAAVVIGALAALSIPLACGLVPPAAAAILYHYKKSGAQARPYGPGVSGGGEIAGAFILALLGGQVALVLLRVSPAHTLTDERYLGPVWPFVALAMVRALDGRAFRRLGAARWGWAGAGMLVLAGIAAWPSGVGPYAPPDPGARVLIDNPAEGVLLPLVVHLDPDTPVLAATQADLLAAPDRWLAALRADGGLYSSLPSYTATEQGRAAILARIGAGVDPARGRYAWQADFHRAAERVYRVTAGE